MTSYKFFRIWKHIDSEKRGKFEMNNDEHLDLSVYEVRTDLAVEAHELASRSGVIPGVKIEEDEDEGILISRITVETAQAGQAIGKMPGQYITFEVPGLRTKDTPLQDRVATKLAQEFQRYLHRLNIPDNAKILVIGLGNWNVTADAIGPIVVENLLVTRHYFELQPDRVSPGYRQVSALSPGVMGITGIETSEIVQGIVDRTKPDLIIAVDALASRALERVNTTIQIADTGISPGSGVGNKRKALNRETLGVPVIAIGVPTVVDAVTIASDTIDFVLDHLQKQVNPASNPPSGANPDQVHNALMGSVGQLTPQEKRQLIHEVLYPIGHNLMVTPKEVDAFVEDIANIIANGLNAALHDAVDVNNVSAYTH
jgi:spore protease